mmetsp:Transcript_14512/g.21182  ORF Transcript_14512/g.21182 Transcript_14512/m.21182 type:complete len:86 (-) Transcript_14512:626-883(-)
MTALLRCRALNLMMLLYYAGGNAITLQLHFTFLLSVFTDEEKGGKHPPLQGHTAPPPHQDPKVPGHLHHTRQCRRESMGLGATRS